MEKFCFDSEPIPQIQQNPNSTYDDFLHEKG